MKVLVLILSLVSFLCSSNGSYSRTIKQDPKLVKNTLPNGLTYYIYPNAYPKGEAVYRLFIKSGSVLEDEAQLGLAHFVEHMAFNGTKHFPDNGIIKFLESKGAKFGKDLNAHTSMNETVYKLQLPSTDPNMVDSTLLILADWAGGLLMDSLQIEKERGVIVSEWLSKIGPKYDAQIAFLNELLSDSRYLQRKTIGDTAVIKHFKHETIKRYYRDWYNPKLMAIAVAGDVDVVQVEKIIRERFGELRATKGLKYTHYPIPPYKKVEVKQVVHESLQGIELNSMEIVPKFKPVRKEAHYREYLTRVLINQLMRSRFTSLSYTNPPYKKAFYGSQNFLNTTGVLLGSVELMPGKIDSGIIAYTREVERIFKYGFVQKEIEKAKKNLNQKLARQANQKSPLESNTYMEFMYADFYGNQPLITPEKEYALYLKEEVKIDSAYLLKTLRKMRNLNKTHYMVRAFEKVRPELPSDERLIALMDSVRKSPISPYALRFDLPEKWIDEEPVPGKIIARKSIREIDALMLQCSNGTRVVYKHLGQEKNRLTLSAFRKGGMYALDSTDYLNATVAGTVIPMSGAGAFSREAFSYYRSGSSASVNFLMEKTRSGIVGGASTVDTEDLFRLFYLKWTQPRLDTSVFKQLREKSIEAYRTANRTAADTFRRELVYLTQGKSYVTREITDRDWLEKVSVDRLLYTYDQSFGPASGYTFVLIGSPTLEELTPFIEKYIAALPTGSPSTEYVYPGPRIPEESVEWVGKVGESSRAEVSLIYQMKEVGQPFSDYRLMHEVAKSVLRMKLLKELREEMGKVYSVSVSMSSTLNPTPLTRSMVAFSTAPEHVETLVTAVDERIKFLIADPASILSELTDVKSNLLKSNKLDRQRSSYWSAYIRDMLFNGDENWRSYEQYQAQIQQITPEQVVRHIQQCFSEAVKVKSVLYPKK